MKSKKKMWILMAVVFICTMMLGAVSVSAATRVVQLSQNKWYTDNSRDTSQTVYHKIKISKPGYIVFNGYGYSAYSSGKYSLGLQMCNSKKKVIQTDKLYLYSSNNFKNYVAVKKGTYYVRVDDYQYKLKYTFKAVTDKSGAVRSKAKSVARNKSAQGLAVIGEKGSKTDWYKFTLPTSRKVTFTFGARANGWIEFEIVSADPNVRFTSNKAYQRDTTNTQTTQIVLPKGSYYVQVRRMGDNKNTSGFYTLKWK